MKRQGNIGNERKVKEEEEYKCNRVYGTTTQKTTIIICERGYKLLNITFHISPKQHTEFNNLQTQIQVSLLQDAHFLLIYIKPGRFLCFSKQRQLL
jgi:hypothetical protein